MFGPLPIFWGAIWIFWGPHITISETQSYTLTCPYNMQGPSYIALKFRGSASSPVQIGRSLRKQGEVIDCCIQKTEKNSLWSDFSLIEIKKKHKKKQSLIRLLLAFHPEKFGWYFWNTHDLAVIVFYLFVFKSPLIWSLWYLWSIADLSLSKWKCYVIRHIQKKEKCQDNCPSRLSGRLSCRWDYSHYEKINTQSQWWTNQYTFSMLFSRADLRESMIFYDFFSRRCLHRCFHFSFTYEVSAAV